MVVDDTSVSRALIVDALDQMGVRGVVIAKDGMPALSALKVQPVHLVISDMNMPGLDGLGLLKGLREHKPTSPDRVHSGDRQRRQDADRARAAVQPEQLCHEALYGHFVAGRHRGRGRKTGMIDGARPERRIHIVQGEYKVSD